MDPEKHQSLISGLYVGIHTSVPPHPRHKNAHKSNSLVYRKDNEWRPLRFYPRKVNLTSYSKVNQWISHSCIRKYSKIVTHIEQLKMRFS